MLQPYRRAANPVRLRGHPWVFVADTTPRMRFPFPPSPRPRTAQRLHGQQLHRLRARRSRTYAASARTSTSGRSRSTSAGLEAPRSTCPTPASPARTAICVASAVSRSVRPRRSTPDGSFIACLPSIHHPLAPLPPGPPAPACRLTRPRTDARRFHSATSGVLAASDASSTASNAPDIATRPSSSSATQTPPPSRSARSAPPSETMPPPTPLRAPTRRAAQPPRRPQTRSSASFRSRPTSCPTRRGPPTPCGWPCPRR